MMALMPLESSCDSTASNWVDSHETCNGSHGLLQIGCIHGYTVEQLYDPALNIEAGYAVWKKQGYEAWTTYQKLLANQQ